jgi:GAF domain-containing protein
MDTNQPDRSDRPTFQFGHVYEVTGRSLLLFSLASGDRQQWILRDPTAALNDIDAWVLPQIDEEMQAAPSCPNENERLAALRNLSLPSIESRHFDEVARQAAEAFGVPIALVSVVDEAHQTWLGAAGLPPQLDACRNYDRNTSVCGHVAALSEMVVVEDVSADPRFANNPFLVENGIRFYAGAPLQLKSGYVIGTLCLIDLKPRSISHEDRARLSEMAQSLARSMESEFPLNK